MAERMLPAARGITVNGPPVLVPVPITKAKRRERGFNQAELLALGLSRRSGWPIEPILIRTGGGPPLARLGRVRREETVRRAFAIRASPPGDRFASSQSEGEALLVDDVITTGATAVACAETLVGAGVRCCGVVSFSRADPLDEIA
jgi:predicted amidophosphoribosyltransferase